MPVAMIALGTIILLATGWYVHHRLSTTDRERRTDTIERMASEAVDEPGTETDEQADESPEASTDPPATPQ